MIFKKIRDKKWQHTQQGALSPQQRAAAAAGCSEGWTQDGLEAGGQLRKRAGEGAPSESPATRRLRGLARGQLEPGQQGKRGSQEAGNGSKTSVRGRGTFCLRHRGGWDIGMAETSGCASEELTMESRGGGNKEEWTRSFFGAQEKNIQNFWLCLCFEGRVGKGKKRKKKKEEKEE